MISICLQITSPTVENSIGQHPSKFEDVGVCSGKTNKSEFDLLAYFTLNQFPQLTHNHAQMLI